MTLSRLLAAFAVFLNGVSAFAADWKPAPAPLMTKWGKQVTPENAWTEYPRPQLVRRDWQNLNGLWDYAITKKGSATPETWDGKILVPFCVESALSGVGKSIMPDQNLWYRRTVEAPANWKGRRVLLHFSAVDWESTIFLNGRELGTHRGGSDPFSFDITDSLQTGGNELVLRIWDPTDAGSQPRGKQKLKPESIWYTPVTGIWQTAWMEPVPDGRFDKIEVVTDRDLKGVRFRFQGAGIKPGDRIAITVNHPDNAKSVFSSLFKTEATLPLEKPALWTPDQPSLYAFTATLQRGGKDIDTVTSYFAVRTIITAKDNKGLVRMMLNGQPVFQIGPLDQGWWPDGLLTPPSDVAMKYDLEVLKKLGFNMLRKHIKVEPSRYYHHCDLLGLLVWQDMPSGMSEGRRQGIQPNARTDAFFNDEEKKQFKVELKAMMDHLRVFPCIVVWVPFNEGWGQHDTNEILKWVKGYDPSRLVDGPSGWTDRGFGDMKDMHNYPGPGMFPPMTDRASVLGEFGGLGLPLPGHLWKEKNNWGYQNFKTTDDLRQRYHQLTQRLHPLIGRGLSAAVYTQTTDVEVEVNGLMTYDREIIKLDVADAVKWHKALFGPPPVYRDLVPTSQTTAQKWRHTTAKPADGWEKPEFDAAKWSEAEGGFGTQGTPGAIVRTEWKTADIWLRRGFELKEVPDGEVQLRLHHDEDADVYINGVLAAKFTGYTTDYFEAPLTADARKALKIGANVIAIHCHQTAGGQYIDAGLIAVMPGK